MVDPHFPFCAALVAMLACAGAARACEGLAEGPDGTVVAVLDGNSVKLDSGIVVKLIGTRAPLPAGHAGAPAEPLADEAKAALERLVLHKPVQVGLDTEETDRYGRTEAELFVDEPDGAWVEGALLADGLARVEPSAVNRLCLDEMLSAEAGARLNGLGIWADPYYSVRDAGDPAALGDRTGHYELVEGEIVGTGAVRDRVYLDFGRVWKDDFTATIEGKAAKLFTAAGVDPLALKGKRVRVRGWLEDRDGPLIELGSPAQIEVLASK